MRLYNGVRVGGVDTRRVRPPSKQADPELLTTAHRQWAREIIRRAGHRCEWVERGERCAETVNLVADHIVERKDGGAALDLSNGQCLCVRHNTIKGIKARAARAKGRGV